MKVAVHIGEYKHKGHMRKYVYLPHFLPTKFTKHMLPNDDDANRNILFLRVKSENNLKSAQNYPELDTRK